MLIKPNIIKVRQDDGTFSELQNLMVGEQDIVPAKKVEGLSKVAISGHYKDLEGAPDPKDLIVDAGIEVGTKEPERTSIDVWIDTNQGQTTYRIPEVKDNLINEQDTWSSQKINSEIEEFGNSSIGIEDIELKAPFLDSSNYSSIAYGNGKFVLVRGNCLACTANCATWISIERVTYGIELKSIVYGNGKFVCVGDTNAFYSKDGMTWTAITLPKSVNKIAYGNGKFVAIGGTDVIYSGDGLTWTTGTTLPTSSLDTISFCKDRFIIYGTGYTSLLYSTDAITWSSKQKPNAANCIIYGSGKFISFSSYGEIAYSEDFNTWTEKTIASSSINLKYAIYSNERFVVFSSSSSSNFAMYSDDGITWTKTTLPKSISIDCVCNNKYIIVEGFNNSTYIYYSEDGITWKNTYPVLSQKGEDITKDVELSLNMGAYKTNTNYTLGEVLTGDTWIDGKPIYRFIWQGTTSLKKAQGVVCHLPEGHFDTVFTLRGLFKRTTDNNWFAIPNGYYGGTGWTVNLRTDIATDGPDGILVGFGEEYTDSNRPIIIFAEYTKK